MDAKFLTRAEVLRLHEMQLEFFGGSAGVRDLGLLESAMGNVEATFGGVHQTLQEMGVEATEDELYDLVIGVAEGRIAKDAVASFFEAHSAPSSLPL